MASIRVLFFHTKQKNVRLEVYCGRGHQNCSRRVTKRENESEMENSVALVFVHAHIGLIRAPTCGTCTVSSRHVVKGPRRRLL